MMRKRRFAYGAWLLASGQGGETASISNLWALGGFFPNGWWGTWVGVIVAIFSYLSLESIAIAAGVAFAKTRPADAPVDELVVMCTMVGIALPFLLAVANKVLKLSLLSAMAEKVTFVLIPPLGLIFLVLGTIFLGIATPTEGGAMGASGALLMAAPLIGTPLR